MRATQALVRAVQTRPGHRATVCHGRVRTWAQVGDRVARLAAALRQLGVQRGGRVAILALNSDRYIEALYAAAWAGAVVVPLNTRWSAEEIRFALADCSAEAVFVDDDFVPTVAALLPGLPMRSAIHVGEQATPAGFLDYETLVAGTAPMPDEGGADDDLHSIFYTGGTTGQPKGVMLTHRNINLAGLVWISSLHVNAQTVYLHAAGMFHLAGAGPVFAVTQAGGTHVPLPRFEPEAIFETIQANQVNYCLFVPTMVNTLLNHPRRAEFDLTSVRDCHYGGSPIPDALLLAAMEKLPTWRFHQGYGMTETTALLAVLPWHRHLDAPDAPARRLSVGQPVVGVEVKIVDADGHEVPRGTVGEIVARGGVITQGYWHQPEASAAALQGGWLHTGDGAYMDDEGFLFIVDRLKDMIISGGENVYSGEVENAIYKLPGVLECAVFAVPDAQWGERVHAVVVPKEGETLTAEQIVAHCRTLIAGYKCPRSLVIQTERLPTSAAGKIQKALLREPYWAGQQRAV